MLLWKNFINEKVWICENTNSYDFGNGLVWYRPLSTNTDDVASGNNWTASWYVYADWTVEWNVTMWEDNNWKYVYCNGTRALVTGTSAKFNLWNLSHLNFQPTNSFELIWKWKFSSFPTTQSCWLFGRYFSAAINLTTTWRIAFWLRNSTATSQVYVTPNNTCLVDTVYTLWLSYDGSAKKLYAYINWVLQNTWWLSITLTDFNNTSRYLWDQAQTDWDTYSQPTTHYFAGVFNRQLTDSERTLFMNKAKDDYSPVSSWLVWRWSWKDYAWTASVPTTLYDKNNLVQGNIAWTSAYNFDGINDYIQWTALSTINSTSPRTFVTVFKTWSDITTTQRIVWNSTTSTLSYIWMSLNNSILSAWVYNSGYIAKKSMSVSANTWYCAVVTFDWTNTINLVVNNVTANWTTNSNLSGGIYLHIWNSSTWSPFWWAISNVIFRNRVLSDAEILALYNKINQYG